MLHSYLYWLIRKQYVKVAGSNLKIISESFGMSSYADLDPKCEIKASLFSFSINCKHCNAKHGQALIWRNFSGRLVFKLLSMAEVYNK